LKLYPAKSPVFIPYFAGNNKIKRSKEIQLLQKMLLTRESELVGIPGSRRVGKTFLVRQIFKDSLVFEITAFSLQQYSGKKAAPDAIAGYYNKVIASPA
jgi:AAA+ ATPase superfamily predicted ATPase